MKSELHPKLQDKAREFLFAKAYWITTQEMPTKCYYHPNKLLAPLGIAILLKRGQERETAERLNVEDFTDYEKDEMRSGTMRHRHFVYETYCQDIPFSYE